MLKKHTGGVHQRDLVFVSSVFVILVFEVLTRRTREACVFLNTIKMYCQASLERSSCVDCPAFSTLYNLLHIFSGRQSKRQEEV